MMKKEKCSTMTTQSTDAALRDGIPVDKGVAIGEEWAEKNEVLLRNYWDYFTRYPDMFLDTIAAKDCPIHLFYYQRILLRVMMRFRYVFGTFTRATSKSWIAIIS